jgi:methionyl-tRNA synthetase
LQIQEQAPWKLNKDPAAADQVDAFLYYLAECIRVSAVFLSPIMPAAAGKMLDQLNWQTASGEDDRFRLEHVRWAELPDGHTVNPAVPLFPRIELNKRA